MSSNSFITAYDENTGFIKPIPVDDSTLAPVTSTDVREKYGYSAGGADFAVGRRKLFPTTFETSKSQLKNAKRAEGHVTWSGGLATLAMALVGVKLDDDVYAEIVTEPTETADLVSAVATEGVVTFTLSAANTSNDAVLYYSVYSSPDTLLPTMASAVRNSDTQITVTLAEIVDAATITKSNAGGFVVKETGAPGTAYAVSAIAPGSGNDKVVLTVANMAVSAKEGVTVTYVAGGNGTVADVAGNAMATDATGVAVAAWDLVAPTMVSVVRDSDTQLTLTLSESMLASTVTKANDGGFVVYETGTPATTYAVSAIAPGSPATKVVLTVADCSASSLAGLTVTYVAGGNGTASDVGGNLLATNAVGVVVAAWDAVPTMLSAERIANTTLRVTLSEDADTATTTKANDGGFVVYETGAPGTTYAVSAIAPNGGNHNQVDLTVASVLASAAAGITVTYVKGGNGTVADTTGNLLETDAVGVLIAAW